MGLSLQTLALARKYANQKAKEAVTQSIQEAVAQSKVYTDTAVSQLVSFTVEIVDVLPTENIKTHTIYFVPRYTVTEGINSYYEYMYINGYWELLGTTDVDLSDYYTKEQVNELIIGHEFSLPIASTTQLGGVKIDGSSIVINDEGVISVNYDSTTGTDSPYRDATQKLIDDNFDSIENAEIWDLFK